MCNLKSLRSERRRRQQPSRIYNRSTFTNESTIAASLPLHHCPHSPQLNLYQYRHNTMSSDDRDQRQHRASFSHFCVPTTLFTKSFATNTTLFRSLFESMFKSMFESLFESPFELCLDHCLTLCMCGPSSKTFTCRARLCPLP